MFGNKKTGDSLTYSKVHSLIGEGTQIRGDLESTGTLRIDGFMEGTIHHSGELIVGPKGRVVANVRAKNMAIAGEVHGDIMVEGKLELLSTARVQGDIKYGRLIIHEGALFKGRIEAAAADTRLEPAPVQSSDPATP